MRTGQDNLYDGLEIHKDRRTTSERAERDVILSIDGYDTIIYQIYREQHTHENDLINHRNMWLVLFQTSMLAVYYGLFQSFSQPTFHGNPLFVVVVLAAIIPVIGCVNAWVLYGSLRAAIMAMNAAEIEYKSRRGSSTIELYPKKEYAITGKWAAFIMPLTYFPIWLILSALAVYVYGH